MGWLLKRIAVFLIGAVLGLGASMAVTQAYLSQAGWARGIANLAHDAMFDAFRWSGGDRAPRVTLFDIDDAAYDALGQPPVTPREAVGRLVSAAAAGGAEGIVVDIDLTQPAIDLVARDGLADVLRTLGAQTPVVLVRPVGDGGRRGPDGAAFDPVVSAVAGLRWAGAEVAMETDGVIRRAPLGYCLRSGAEPSVFALGAELVGAGPEEDLEDACAFGFDLDTSFSDEAFIAYLSSGAPVGADGARRGGGASTTETGPFIRRVAALTVLDAGPGGLSADAFAGDVVVIGASHRAASDMVATPVGSMPGALVIANTISGWGAQGAPTPAPPVTSQALFVGAFALAGYLLIGLRRLLARSGATLVRLFAHPVVYEKLLIAGMIAVWAVLLGPFMASGLWVGVLVGAIVAVFVYFLEDVFVG